mgnify:FL=1
MTDDERQRDVNCKKDVCEWLAGIHLEAYGLGQIDRRLNQYAKSLLSDFDAHNLYELLALKRFFVFLDKYDFHIDAAQRYFKFYEYLQFSGQHGRTRYKLTPVQVFQFANIMGFYKDEQHRLCNNVLLFVPRKYSKTTSVTSFAVHDFLFGDKNAQVFTGANTYEQAKICFDEIRSVLRGLDPDLSRFKLNREAVTWLDPNIRESKIRCLASNADKLDGLNGSTVIMDEYAQADDSNLYTVLTTSMAMRENPLTIVLTTASDKINGPFFEMLEAYKRVLRGEAEQDNLFAHIFQPDPYDDEGDPHTWAKAQPHLGITVKKEFYEDFWAKAQMSRDDLHAFRTKLLNIFDEGDAQTWITGQEIRDHFRNVDIDNLPYHALTEVAVDLSVDNDFSAVSYYVYLEDERRAHLHTEYYFPRDRIKEHPNRELYKKWAADGFLKLCDGSIIDYDMIFNDIMTHGRNLRILRVGFDPYKSLDFQNKFIAAGYKNYLYQYKQTYSYFTAPVLQIARMLAEGNLSFSPNPITAYCFDNCVLMEDRTGMGNFKPVKREKNKKIDGAITCTMAVGMDMTQESPYS